MGTTITTTRARGLRVAELAEAVGLSPDTIRYYERAGLLPPPATVWSGPIPSHRHRYTLLREGSVVELQRCLHDRVRMLVFSWCGSVCVGVWAG
jgi:hypothetical protein